MKQVSLWVSHWFIYSIDSFKRANSLINKTSEFHYERLVESFITLIYPKVLIHLATKPVIIFMSVSLNHSLNWLIQKWLLMKKVIIFLSKSIDLLKNTESFSIEILCVSWCANYSAVTLFWTFLVGDSDAKYQIAKLQNQLNMQLMSKDWILLKALAYIRLVPSLWTYWFELHQKVF